MRFLRGQFLAALVIVCGAAASAAEYFEEDPIRYSQTAATDDPVTLLQKRIDAGQLKLAFDDRHGYLPSVLSALGIDTRSQVLCFSKTSLQIRKISPRAPRAIYFNDTSYIGWVQGGEVLEIASIDSKLGTVFYTLNQTQAARPKFARASGDCLGCHASTRTNRVPGLFVRSVYPDPSGHPILRAGSFTTRQSSPMTERWGGWYVTGMSGRMAHMGNALVPDPKKAPDRLSSDATTINRRTVGDRFDIKRYLTPHSDIVALMVLEHQCTMQNLMVEARYQTLRALRDQAVLDKLDGRPDPKGLTDSIRRRIEHASERVVRHMLFVDEAPLDGSIEGTSGFTEAFAARAPRDKRGRSLADFELEGRMFTYPCSYLIYSPFFEAMPEQVKSYIYRRLGEVLTGRDRDKAFDHLAMSERRAIVEILTATKKNLPPGWPNAAE